MSIIFYDHLIDKTEVLVIIEKLDEPDNIKNRFRHLVDDILHQGIIAFILGKLHPSHHPTFLDRLHSAPYDPELLDYLKDHIYPQIEEEIAHEATRLLDQIKKDFASQ